MKEYSCVKRTRKSFETSLAELSKDYPLNKITVKMLCEHAELSRNAFYSHYSDINELVQDIENNMIESVSELIDGFGKTDFPDNILATIEQLPLLLMSHRDTTLMLLDASYSVSFTNRLNKIFSDFNYQYYKRYHMTESRTSYDYFYRFISDGFYGMLRQWLHEPESISQVKFTRLAYSMIKRLLVTDEPDLTSLKRVGTK